MNQTRKNTCGVCDNIWWTVDGAVVVRPAFCPKCHSPYWDRKKVVVEPQPPAVKVGAGGIIERQ